MKRHLKSHTTSGCRLTSLTLAATLALPLPALAESVTLATSPLATSTTSTVKPNILLVLDNSGSMAWDHMPDDSGDGGSAVTFSFGYYGLRSSQCNQVYYNPAVTYTPPIKADGTSYAAAAFSGAKQDGFDSTSSSVDLRTSFKASLSRSADTSGQAAYYYNYSGVQTTALQKNYNSTTNTFYNECHSAQSASPGQDVFTRISLSATAAATTATVVASGNLNSTSVSGIKVNGTQEIMSGTAAASADLNTVALNIAAQINLCTAAKVGNCTTTGGHGYTATVSGPTVTISGLAATATTLTITKGNAGTMTLTPTIFPIADAAKLTNFANWYSYYRTRMLMMKTATGHAFSSLNDRYRVGLMKISASSTPVVPLTTFEGTLDTEQRGKWYKTLYDMIPDGSTPLRTALSDAGRYYAGKLSGTDPVQYSCQQNFTLLSTDGYWNTGNGYKLDGSTAVGNQDGAEGRPYNDGATPAGTTVTTSYARNSYSSSRTEIGGGSSCAKGSSRVIVTAQIRSCAVTTSPAGVVGAAVCTSWVDGSKTYLAPYTSNTSTCATNGTFTVPATSTATATGESSAETSSGGTSDNLADIAMYYYKGPLRSVALGNCGSPVSPATVGPLCGDDVFIAGADNNRKQHMTTFTLGLGASGKMNYSSTYINDSVGDYAAVKLGSTTNLAPSTITVSGSGSTSVSSITVNGVQLMSGASTASTDTNTVAANIAAKITLNSFSATASGATVTITGPAAAANFTPVVTQAGAMVLTAAAGTPTCSWQANGTVCNWPVPGMDGSGNGYIENIDDLWHAAVNGRGAYFSATDPTSLSAGLANALAGINARKGSAAAAATSTLNPVAGNNFAYVASYTTVSWRGNLEARSINTETGVVSENATWCVENVAAGTCAAPGTIVADISGDATVYNCVTPNSVICTNGVLDGSNCKVQIATTCTGTMNSLVSDTSDTRTIKTPDSAGSALIDFDAAYATANPTNFAAAHIGTLTQWSSLTAAQQTAAAGTSLVKYLRGQYGYEERSTNAVANRLYRTREAVLGDALESQPAFIGKPMFSYPYPGYSAFATAQASRAGTVYMGANDGMLHAFAADTGVERWAYVPSMVIPEMWKLADTNYAVLHRNFVNGSPSTSDICTANCTCDDACVTAGGTAPVWKTILVAGLNGGGRGYYALDITTPSTPVLLWELTPTTGNGTIKNDDVGYGFGQPIITRKGDGTWVVLVTSGYNNTSPGDGKGYLYVLNASTGAIISKISTGEGSTSTITGVCTTAPCPSGLAKIAGWNDEPAGNQTTYVYGGDLMGNLWRFNINSATTATIGTGEALKFATLFSNSAGTGPQPIMTTPVLGQIAGKRVVFVGTGKYLENGDLSTTQTQTHYGIKDDDATSTLVNPRTTLVQQTLSNNPDGTATRVATSAAVNFYTGRGWFFDLPDSGERENIDSKLVQGTLLIPSIVPRNTVCSPGGYGWLNFVDYKTGGALDPASPVASAKYDATIVGINVIYIDGKPKVSVVTSADPTPKLNDDVGFGSAAAGFTGKRILWREFRP